jgi:hypothetical protein
VDDGESARDAAPHDVLAGNEAAIGGVRPTYWKPYDKQFETRARVAQVLSWLALPTAERPSIQQPLFRGSRHRRARLRPDSPNSRPRRVHRTTRSASSSPAVHRLGSTIGRRSSTVSDHGMTPVSYARVVYLDAFIDLSTVDVIESGSSLQLNPRDGDAESLYRRLHGKHPNWRSTGGRTCLRACISAISCAFQRSSAFPRRVDRDFGTTPGAG